MPRILLFALVFGALLLPVAGARAAVAPRSALPGAVMERVEYFGQTVWSGPAAAAVVALYDFNPQLARLDPSYHGPPPGYLALTESNRRGVFVLRPARPPRAAWVWVGLRMRSYGHTSWWTAVEPVATGGACRLEVVVLAELV